MAQCFIGCRQIIRVGLRSSMKILIALSSSPRACTSWFLLVRRETVARRVGPLSSKSPVIRGTSLLERMGPLLKFTKLDGVEEAVSGHTVLRASKAKFHIP